MKEDKQNLLIEKILMSPKKERKIFIVKNKNENNNKYPANKLRNQKYYLWSFLFVCLFEQLKNFSNLYFFIEAILKSIPRFRIGSIIIGIGPFMLVIFITLLREGYEDYMRYLRDKKANSEKYSCIKNGVSIVVPSSDLKVGDLVWISKNERVPADVVLLKTTEKDGSVFIRTDQLDGETDWKLKVSVGEVQRQKSIDNIFDLEIKITAEEPQKDIHTFNGTMFFFLNGKKIIEPLNIENVLWMNTVVASDSALGCVIYTGKETRSQMNKNKERTKTSKLMKDLNLIMGIIICILSFISFFLAFAHHKGISLFVYTIRFVLIFSSMIPLSIRVCIELAEYIQSVIINKDKDIPNTITRNSKLTEELGRIKYLLSDKTGTLTKNEMMLKKICVGTLTHSVETFHEVAEAVCEIEREGAPKNSSNFLRCRDLNWRLYEITRGLSLCHNVISSIENGEIFYKASSPDEIAIVNWTDSVGIKFVERNRNGCVLSINGRKTIFSILQIFPFTPERKRMGVVVKEMDTKKIFFFEKGADIVMKNIVKENDWLEEETKNLSREGLRTLVIGMKYLNEKEYNCFEKAYSEAKVSLKERQKRINETVDFFLEKDLELLGITGVEDILQDDLCTTLESLRNAGIKIWVLTGDKIETAKCVAVSSRLVIRGQNILTISEVEDENKTFSTLERNINSCLAIDGNSIEFLMKKNFSRFLEITTKMTCIVCCRCTPTQKSNITEGIKKYTGEVVCCIGDGGNDISMLHSANVGIGIVGKEGKQASLASDFSIEKFKHINKLFLWYGRNSYTCTSKLAHYIIHRGFILTVIQLIFSIVFYFSPVQLYKGMVLVGYVTVYTTFPLISLLLDYNANLDVVLRYPILYKELTKGRLITPGAFFSWISVSTYQGWIIASSMFIFFKNDLIMFVSITFTALILNELFMLLLMINQRRWHVFLTLFVSFLFYFTSLFFLKEGFDIAFMLSLDFLWKVSLVTFLSFFPIMLFSIFKKKLYPKTYQKL